MIKKSVLKRYENKFEINSIFWLTIGTSSSLSNLDLVDRAHLKIKIPIMRAKIMQKMQRMATSPGFGAKLPLSGACAVPESESRVKFTSAQQSGQTKQCFGVCEKETVSMDQTATVSNHSVTSRYWFSAVELITIFTNTSSKALQKLTAVLSLHCKYV